ncbi:MAG: hypothetical protein PHN44_00025 [Candidatus Marinimicrobia bacterium]|nr:hypothetical protein [Candidatus Neomarinimicrobiota bacterium]
MKGKRNATMECAPKIWKKLSMAQQKMFTDLNQIFVDELTLLMTQKSPNGKFAPIISGNTQVAAHNLACEAVWELARQSIIEGRKPAHNKA